MSFYIPGYYNVHPDDTESVTMLLISFAVIIVVCCLIRLWQKRQL